MPSINDPFDFFLIIKFLIMGDLCIIDKKNSYILKRGVYVIFLNIDMNNDILQYLYYKFNFYNILNLNVWRIKF